MKKTVASFSLSLSLVAIGGQLPAAAQLQTFQLQWGQLGAGNGDLDAPWGVAVDASTNVFVAEGDNCRVSKFSSTGTFITKVGSKGTGAGQFGCTGPPFFNQKSPTGLAVGPSGSVYAADFTGGRLHKFTNNLTLVTTWSTVFNAFDVQSDAAENIYVVGELGTIQKFSNTGTLITSWSVSGRPKAIAFDTSGNAYIAVVDNTFTAYTVDKFTNAGVPLGTVIGPVATPSSNITMTLDADNNIYTYDGGNGVRKFNNSGGLLGTIAPAGSADGQVVSSLGMAAGGDLSLYVADFALNRIVKYQPGAPAIPPVPITDLAADQATETTIRLTWSAPSDDGLVVSYDLRRSLSLITPANFAAATPIPAPAPGLPGSLQLAVSSGLAAGTQYFFAVRATDDASITSDISNIASTSTLSSPVQQFISHFGVLGTGDGQFNFPYGVAVDASSHVYVSDANNCRIQKFDNFGNFVAKWGTQGTGNGQFSCTGAPTFNLKSPAGIAIGPSGNLYALDFPANRLQKFTNSGTFITKWNTDSNPTGVAVDAAERVYVIHGTKQVVKFSSTGVITGGFSVAPDNPISIALDSSGNLYIAAVDSGLTFYRIRKFTNNGGDLGTVIGPVSISNSNVAVALDSKDNIYTTDHVNGVRQFNSNGVLKGSVALAGSGEGQVFVSLGMALDGARSLFVGDPALQRITKFGIDFVKPAAVADLTAGQPTETSALLAWTAPVDSDGVVAAYEIRTAPFAITPANFASAALVPNPPVPASPGSPESITVNGLATGRAHYFALRSIDGTNIKSDLSNVASTATLSSPIQSSALQFGETGAAAGQFNFPYGIAVDESSNVYVADANNCRMQKFTNTGAFILAWGSQGTGDGQFGCTGSPTFNLKSPAGISIGPSGNVYTLDTPANRLQKFTPSGAFVAKWNTAGTPLGVAVDAAENVFVANQVGTVQKFSSVGALLTSWSVSPFRANSIAIDPVGNVVVMSDDISTYKVERFNSNGNFLNTVVPPTSVASFNVALAVDKAGDVYTFDTGNGIRKFNGVGDFKGVVAPAGSGPGQVSVSLGMDTDFDRNLYVSDAAQNRVHVFSPAVSQSTTTVNGQPEVVFVSDVPNVTLTVVAPENPPVALALGTATAQGLQLVSNVYEITHTTFNPLASITFRFNPAAVPDTSTLALFRFNGVSWSSGPESGISNQVVLDASDPRVVANVAFTSYFALFYKVDADAPLLGLAPPNGSTIATTTPLIAASYSDSGGIDVASVRLSLDGLDVTAQAAVTASSATFTSTAPLSQGFHTISAQVADLTGNFSSSTATFRVDSLPPITTLLVDGLAASATSLVLISTDSLGFAASDSGTGVFETRYALDGSTSEAVFVSTFSLAVGTHSLAFYSLDLAGNSESVQTVQLEVLAVDTTPPVVVLAPVDGSTVTTTAPLILASYGDSGRGVDADSVQLLLDGVDVTTQAVITTSSAAFTSAALSQGTHTITAQVADLAGNLASAHAVFLIDSLPPETTLLVDGLPAGSTNLLIISTNSLGFAASDSGTGLLETRFSLDGSGESVYASTFSLSAGTHTLSFRSVDIAGNLEAAKAVSLSVLIFDATPPTMALSPIAGSTVSSATPDLSASYFDAGRGIDPESVRLALDGVDLTTQAVVTASSATFTPSSPLSQGVHTFTAQVADLAGNGAASTSTFLVDSVPPDTVLLVNGLAASATSLVIISTDSVGFAATDAGSGVFETRYAVDGSTAEAVFVSTFSLAVGAHTVAFRSVDAAGNVEPLRTVSVQVLSDDATPPNLSLTPPDGSTVTTISPLIAAAYSDLGQGIDVASARLFLDGLDVSTQAVVTASSATFIPGSLSQGFHTIAAQVADLSGNSSSSTATFRVDSVPPITTLLLNGLPASTTSLVVVSTDSFGFSAADSGTGVLETRFSIDGASEAVFLSTFSLSVGTHSLAFRSLDRAGNAEAAQLVSISVSLYDAVPPSLTLVPAAGSTVTTTTPQLLASYSDSGQGIDATTVLITLDGVDVTTQAVVTTSSASFTSVALAQGTHTATAQVADLAGNEAAVSSTFFVDSIAPITTLLVDGLAVSGTSFVLTSTDTVGFAATDFGVGVLETRYALDGGAETVFASAFTLAAGNHSLSFRSVDLAGNMESLQNVAIFVPNPSSDTTPPLARLDFPSSDSLSVEQSLGAIVNVRGVVSDLSAVTWVLEFAPGVGATSGFSTIASGSGNLSGLIATWNTSLLSGHQTLRLRATDAASNSSQVTAAVFVGNPIFDLAIGRTNSDVIVADIKNPQGIAVRPDGNIWVASNGNDRLILLTSGGAVLAQIGVNTANNPLKFVNPQGLALDSANNLYVADKGRDRVVKLTPSGGFIFDLAKRNNQGNPVQGTGPGEFKQPWDVAVDANGDLYVADNGNNRIQVFNSSGSFLRQFGQAVLSSTSDIRGIALAADGVWVSDRQAEKVYLFSRAGSLLKSIGDADSVVGEISRTRGVTTDRTGSLYVVESNRDRTQKFDPQGKGLLSFGTKAQATAAEKAAKRYLNAPVDASIGADGALWVADSTWDRVVRYALPSSGGFGIAAYSASGGISSSDSVEPAVRLVDARDGANVERDDGAGVRVPEGALAADLEITVDKGDENQDKEQKTAKRRELKITAVSEEVQYGPEGTTFSAPVTLTLPYDANLLASLGISEDSLKVYYWNPTLLDWQAMPSVVDKVNKTVNAQTSHFSNYQVGALGGIGVAAIDDFGFRDGYAFPNPSRGGSAVTFRMQPGSADSIEVRVYDLSGRRMHSSSDFRFRGAFDDGNGKGAQNTYDHIWDVSGVGSGVYTFVMTAKKAGEKDIRKTGKVGVIK